MEILADLIFLMGNKYLRFEYVGASIFSTPFDSGFHLSSLRIFASFVFRFLSNPYCYIREVEVFKFQNILGSIRKGIESHRLAQIDSPAYDVWENIWFTFFVQYA
ncbi:hypothetical protein L3X38_038959 [Prunus dulcis]|uniref:Uncharacterized protein n=1 Tax=Prunus dulcis TaxID=3755 RepID=A0AAD4YRZ6_PRUDU|nr:hypothetical protein L3X38_038959 [Prunus dulcis]